jgi:arylsulfatase A-like enzyme
LEKSPQADNTIVVLWSDHGYHLGEKAISGKNSLWARSTRVPLLMAGPGVPVDVQCSQPAELMDLYPTLAEFVGLPAPQGVEGLSLVPQIRDPSTPRERPAICTHNAGNHSVCDTRWRYVRYAEGSEELYDRSVDPNEYTNLLADGRDRAQVQSVVDELASWLPTKELPLAPGSAARILEKREDGFYWEEKKIIPSEKME